MENNLQLQHLLLMRCNFRRGDEFKNEGNVAPIDLTASFGFQPQRGIITLSARQIVRNPDPNDIFVQLDLEVQGVFVSPVTIQWDTKQEISFLRSGLAILYAYLNQELLTLYRKAGVGFNSLPFNSEPFVNQLIEKYLLEH